MFHLWTYLPIGPTSSSFLGLPSKYEPPKGTTLGPIGTPISRITTLKTLSLLRQFLVEARVVIIGTPEENREMHQKSQSQRDDLLQQKDRALE